MAAWTAAHHPQRVARLVLNTPGNIANKPEVMARLVASTTTAVDDPSDENVRRRVAWLFHDTAQVTDELVNLRRSVYSRPGFRTAIANTLVLQDPVTRARLQLGPVLGLPDHRAHAAALDRPRPHGRSRRGRDAAGLAR